MKLVAKGNKSLYEKETHTYTFILTRFNSYINQINTNIDTIKTILRYVLDIALEVDFDITNTKDKVFVHDKNSLKIFFQMLAACFKQLVNDNKKLIEYVLSPLEALTRSFTNTHALSDIGAQELLLRIMKYTKGKEYQKNISNYIGWISSTHTSLSHIRSLMSEFTRKAKNEKRWEDNSMSLFETLIGCISGDIVRELYFFPGSEGSFIELKASLVNPSKGLLCTGYIRYEENKNKQCIFSFLDIKDNEIRGIELHIERRRLTYTMVCIKELNESLTVLFPEITLTEGSWHHITISHIGNELETYVDSIHCTIKVESDLMPKKYTHGFIGAGIDSVLKKPRDYFFGEIAALYFFKPTSKLKIQDLANQKQDTLRKNYCFNLNNEGKTSIYFLLDPKVTFNNNL